MEGGAGGFVDWGGGGVALGEVVDGELEFESPAVGGVVEGVGDELNGVLGRNVHGGSGFAGCERPCYYCRAMRINSLTRARKHWVTGRGTAVALPSPNFSDLIDRRCSFWTRRFFGIRKVLMHT